MWTILFKSQEPSPLMYYAEQRVEWSRAGQKRSDGIMYFCSPYWRCIEFIFSQWLDKISFQSLAFYCDGFFFFFFSSGQWIYSLKLSLWKYFSGIVAGNAPRSVTFNLLFLFICSQDSRGRVIEKKNKAANRWDQKRESWHPFKKWKMRLNGF